MNLLPVFQSNTLATAGKAQLLAYADGLVATRADEGWDVTELLAQAAKLELIAGRIIERAKVAALSDVRAYGRGGVMKTGVVLTARPTGGKPDYSGDVVWQRLNSDADHFIGRRKQHEGVLKALPYEGMLLLNEDTAELYQAHPPAKTGGETVYIEIK